MPKKFLKFRIQAQSVGMAVVGGDLKLGTLEWTHPVHALFNCGIKATMITL